MCLRIMMAHVRIRRNQWMKGNGAHPDWLIRIFKNIDSQNPGLPQFSVLGFSLSRLGLVSVPLAHARGHVYKN